MLFQVTYIIDKKIHFFEDTEAHNDKHLHLQSVIMALLCITLMPV